ncbi:DUF302 domain-containing protein [uncultured Salinisphaera sp.]|uniref:DUF302 domain-containing protein n=1 Tax=uncultured Salinisphaera sp. TaxID=359372 RepID=UPI0032B178F9|tara:strand:- start:7458 stop:7949 length:492 start_codon:yes stop_codon:yes gene_type:complete
MTHRFIATLLLAVTFAVPALAADESDKPQMPAKPSAEGMQITQSPYSAAKTVTRFENVVRNQGLTVFDTIDHAAGAASANLILPATTLVIFGNPKAGTPLMQCSRTVAIDLPSKALIWRENGKTWIGVNDMDYLAARHNMTDCPAVPKVADKLKQVVGQTVAR